MKDGGTSRQRHIQTGDPEGVGRMETFVDRNQDALDLIWADLDGATWAHLPTEFKEAMFKEFGSAMKKLDAKAYQDAVASGEESLSGVNQFFTEMSETETDMLKGQVDINTRQGQEQQAALEAALADYENADIGQMVESTRVMDRTGRSGTNRVSQKDSTSRGRSTTQENRTYR